MSSEREKKGAQESLYEPRTFSLVRQSERELASCSPITPA